MSPEGTIYQNGYQEGMGLSIILFCEYVVLPEHREAYLAWVRSRPEQWADAELAENDAQPGVFVELRRAPGDEEARRMQQERREGRSWREMEAWVKGGADGLRLWTFRPLL